MVLSQINHYCQGDLKTYKGLLDWSGINSHILFVPKEANGVHLLD